MARILVIGGHGFYGRKVVERLEHEHEVAVGSRRGASIGAVELDLRRPETFAALAGFDVLINCSDSVNAPPDAAIAHVLEHGGTWLEMGADAPATERLLALALPAQPRGTAIIGIGVFPGLSTVMAKAAVARAPACTSVDLGIRLSPLSGAGRGNCALMAQSLFVPAFRYVEGARVESAIALGPSVMLPFERDGELRPARAFTVALPDTALVHAACDVPNRLANCATHLAVVPGWLRFNFGLLARVARWFRFARRPLAWMIEWQMIVVRAWLLRGVESRLELVAVTDRKTARERSVALSFVDGQTATAVCVAAAVDAWLRAAEQPVGLFGLAEIVSLDELLASLEHAGAAPNVVWTQ